MTTDEYCRKVALVEIAKTIDNLITELTDIYDHEKIDDIRLAVCHLENSRYWLIHREEPTVYMNSYPREYYND